MRRVVLTAALAGSVKADRPRKRLVETAHPRLREAWAATGVLTEADFAAARADGAPYSVRRSLLGDVDDIPASDCGDDRKRAGAEWCFNGQAPGDMDDDWARTDLMGLSPGACATCGFVDGPLYNGLPAGWTDPWTPATWPFDWPYDCVTCEDPTDQLVVFFRDCTGACVDAAGVEELRALGFQWFDTDEPGPLRTWLSAPVDERVELLDHNQQVATTELSMDRMAAGLEALLSEAGWLP